jgi:protein CpxP
MNHIKKTLLVIIGVLVAHLTMAQGGQRPDPEEMVKREKTLVLDSIPTLSEDQKMLLDMVYEDYAVSMKSVFEGAAGGNREGIREKMQAVRATKDESLEGIFSEEQNTKYKQLMGNNRRGGRGQGGRGQGGQGGRGQGGGRPNN